MRDQNLVQFYESLIHKIERSVSPVQGWKLAGSNHRSRSLVQSNQIIFGPLFESEVHIEVNEIKGLVGSCVELEVAIHERQPGDFEWALCLEFPNPKNPSQEIIDAGQMVANRCDAGSIWVSSALNVSSVSDLKEMDIRFRVGSSEWLRPDFESLVQDPTELYREFIELSSFYGFRTEPIQWVATGGLTPCLEFERETELTIEARGETFAQIILARNLP